MNVRTATMREGYVNGLERDPGIGQIKVMVGSGDDYTTSLSYWVAVGQEAPKIGAKVRITIEEHA